jgi:hypothetical protein
MRIRFRIRIPNTDLSFCPCRYHEEKRYSCDKCEKTFRYLPELNSHRLGHEGKFFSCTICPASFRLDDSIYKNKISFSLKEYYAYSSFFIYFYLQLGGLAFYKPFFMKILELFVELLTTVSYKYLYFNGKKYFVRLNKTNFFVTYY